MAQVPEALSCQVVVLSPAAAVVQVFPPSEVVQGGGAGDCGTSVLNMAASWLSGVFSFIQVEVWVWMVLGSEGLPLG